MSIRVYRIPSEKMDSNSYLVEEDGHAVIIDGSSFAGLVEKIEGCGWTVDHLLLTHEHFDHIWYLEKLRRRYHAPVTACRLCSERIGDVKSNLSNISDVLYYFKTGIVREGKSPAFTCAPADITYEDDFRLVWREHCFSFQRLPGHSPGSVLITLEERCRKPAPKDGAAGATDNGPAAEAPDTRDPGTATGVWAFPGDYLILGEEEILRLKDGSPEDYEAVARPVLERIPPGTRICPGHGPAYIKGREGDGQPALICGNDGEGGAACEEGADPVRRAAAGADDGECAEEEKGQ